MGSKGNWGVWIQWNGNGGIVERWNGGMDFFLANFVCVLLSGVLIAGHMTSDQPDTFKTVH